MRKPLNLMVLGGCLLMAGVALPFLMVTRVLEPNLFLSFLSHGCSTAGFIMGFIGIALHFRRGQ
jgi:hypothetical protein